MSFVETIKNVARKVIPEKKGETLAPPMISSSGSRGMVPFDDEMPITKPAIVYHTLQIFFCFLAMACFASVASFQHKWGVGPSGLSGFAIFIAVTSMLLSLFMLLVPVIYDKYSKLVRLARALQELRVSFILAATGVTETILISFIGTISAWTQPGCKDASKDPNQDKGDAFQAALPGWCRTKKAGVIFFWLAAISWVATLVLAILYWRAGKSIIRPRDPPFRHPTTDDAESVYGRPSRRDTLERGGGADEEEDDELQSPFADQHRYQPANLPAGRASVDTYGAFSDPAPTGYGSGVSGIPPITSPPPRLPNLGFTASHSPPPQIAAQPQNISRTMALAYEDTGTTTYEDPYDKVRASLGGGAGAGLPQPPRYDSTGYR